MKKRKIKAMIRKAVSLSIRAAVTLLIAVPAADTLTYLAYQARGYYAVGGEWAAVLLIAAAVWRLTYYVEQSKRHSVERTKRKIQARSENGALERRTDI